MSQNENQNEPYVDNQNDENNNENIDNNTLSGIMTHLIELRSRFLRALASVLVIFIILTPFANRLYNWLSHPLVLQLPKGESMIAIGVAAPFFVPLKLTFLVAMILAIPFILYQVWAFVAPGLYAHEKKMVLPLLASSTLLFYGGMAFAYYLVFPVTFRFFAKATPHGVKMMTDISAYLDFVTNMFLSFGAAFEVPVAIVLLTFIGVVTPEKLKHARPYIVVGAFAVAMFIAPPDVLSQTSLAIPLILLYEIGLLFARVVYRAKKERETLVDADDDQDDQ